MPYYYLSKNNIRYKTLYDNQFKKVFILYFLNKEEKIL